MVGLRPDLRVRRTLERPVHVEGRACGRPDAVPDGQLQWDWINRNPANGKWFTEHGNGQYKDVKITNLHDTVYRFVAQESGSPYTIVTSDGRKIVMDRGLLRWASTSTPRATPTSTTTCSSRAATHCSVTTARTRCGT